MTWRRRIGRWALVGLLAVCLASCGDDADTSSGDDVANPPEAELADRLGTYGAKASRVSPEDSATLTTVILASFGLDATDRASASPAVVAFLGPDAAGTVGLDRFGTLVKRLRDGKASVSESVVACQSDASTKRRAAGEPAPDRPVDGFVEVGKRLAALEAMAVGMTESEATCYATTALASIDDEGLADALAGQRESTGLDPEAAVAACLTDDRLADVVVALRASIEVYGECVNAQAAQQAEEQATAMAEALKSSTTVTTAVDATTTTAPSCIPTTLPAGG